MLIIKRPILLIILAGLFVLPLAASALQDPETKLEQTIKKFIVNKSPQILSDEIRIELKLSEDNRLKLSQLPENTKFKILEVYPDFKPIGQVIFPIKAGGQKLFIRASVAVMKNIVAAGRQIKRGKVLETADLKIEWRDTAVLPNKYYTSMYPLIGKEAKISVPANSTLLEWMVGDLPLLKRGSEVTIKVAGSGLLLRTRGEVLEDGYLGATVKVKRQGTKTPVVAKVVSSREVEVSVQ